MPTREHIGLDGFSPDQEIWRFMPLWKAKDLFKTRELYLSQVSELRKDDPNESRLPAALKDTFSRLPVSQRVKDFIADFIHVCENQATGVFASCWFLPGSHEHESRMWSKYGGGSDGGIVVISSLERLEASLPDDGRLLFGLGSIRYIQPDIDYIQTFHLNEYRSAPFLLKLSSHQDDREIRLYQRSRGPRQDTKALRSRVDILRLVRSIRISPLCSAKTRQAIYTEFTSKGLPKDLFEGAT